VLVAYVLYVNIHFDAAYMIPHTFALHLSGVLAAISDIYGILKLIRVVIYTEMVSAGRQVTGYAHSEEKKNVDIIVPNTYTISLRNTTFLINGISNIKCIYRVICGSDNMQYLVQFQDPIDSL